MSTLFTRRSFLKTAAVGTAAFSAASWQRVHGANDALRVAIVGFKGRGGDHISGFRKIPGVRIVGLCDVDQRVLEGAVKKLKDDGYEAKGYKDVREVIADKDVDIISTATPNHWHALITVWACQAGKDVYVEKPVSHNVWEGRKAVEAARKYKRIVQTGDPEPLQPRHQGGRRLGAGGESRQDQDRPRPLLQAAAEHRQGERTAADPRGHRLRSLVRAGADGAADAEEPAL